MIGALNVRVILKKHILKFLKMLQDKERIKIKEKLLQLEKFPETTLDIKRLRGERKEVYRCRIGKYRALFYPEYKKKLIVVFDFNKREKIYD